MSTFIAEPGTRLGGRYRLEDCMSASTGWSAWKAIDEILARAVAVLTFAPGFPRITEVVTAARAASRLTDTRLAQVFDVEEDWDHAYVVMEWVGGDCLGDLLADGPLDPGLGAEILAQAAEALGSAHAAGVAHLCLTPGSIHWTSGGGVKIIGLGIDAALAARHADDPALADTQGLGKLLYAALTARWPGDDWPGLAPAMEVDGHLPSPRQMRAGVPSAVDDIACRALSLPSHGGPPITTPAALSAALVRVVPTPAVPPAAPRPAARRPPAANGFGTGTGSWDGTAPRTGAWGPPDGNRPARRPAGAQRPAGARALTSAVVALVIVALGVGAWMLTHQGKPSHSSTSASDHHPTAPPSATVLKPVGATGFDPLSSPADDPGDENSNMAANLINGDPAGWHTQFYFSDRFGGLKRGTGLILDMGKPVRLSSVTVQFGSVPGANVRIEVGNSDTRSPATLNSFTTVQRAGNLPGGSHKFTISSTATGRFLLVWFTKLPPLNSGSTSKFQADVLSVAVQGSG